MTIPNDAKYVSAIFITFSGNCKKALTYYQTCFGGTLQFTTFEKELYGYAEKPIVMGSLVSDTLIIHGSDLVYDEGRTLGNYMSIFLHCKTIDDRQALLERLERDEKDLAAQTCADQKLVEMTDAFDVRWVLAV